MPRVVYIPRVVGRHIYTRVGREAYIPGCTREAMYQGGIQGGIYREAGRPRGLLFSLFVGRPGGLEASF